MPPSMAWQTAGLWFAEREGKERAIARAQSCWGSSLETKAPQWTQSTSQHQRSGQRNGPSPRVYSPEPHKTAAARRPVASLSRGHEPTGKGPAGAPSAPVARPATMTNAGSAGEGTMCLILGSGPITACDCHESRQTIADLIAETLDSLVLRQVMTNPFPPVFVEGPRRSPKEVLSAHLWGTR